MDAYRAGRTDLKKVTDKVLTACPDDQWRLLVVLARYGGLRTPSESLLLRWGDIDWERGRMTVTSPKTEHCGQPTRIVPLFPEIRPILERAFDDAEPGTEYVITRYRGSNQNLRTQMERIIRRAGLTPWGKPFQNMRSTRETELSDEFPIHVVCKWIGNSEAVAKKHDLQTTEAHFEKAVQKAVQQAPESNGKASQPFVVVPTEIETLQAIATPCVTPPLEGIPPRGFEPRLPD